MGNHGDTGIFPNSCYKTNLTILRRSLLAHSPNFPRKLCYNRKYLQCYVIRAEQHIEVREALDCAGRKGGICALIINLCLNWAKFSAGRRGMAGTLSHYTDYTAVRRLDAPLSAETRTNTTTTRLHLLSSVYRLAPLCYSRL